MLELVNGRPVIVTAPVLDPLLRSEPIYNYLSDTYSWEFYNVFNLLQYQMCSGEVRYVLHLNFSKAEILYTTKGKDITEIDFIVTGKQIGRAHV